MKRACRMLLRLYPYDYRVMFADEMARAFDRLPEYRARELAGLLLGAAREWIAKWTTDTMVRGRVMPDVRMMRPVGVTKELWFGRS